MLKAILDNLDGLGESESKHYKQGEDGRYTLDVEGVEGLSLTNVTQLQTALSGARGDLKKATKAAEKFGDLDPEAARAAITRVTELEEQLGGKDNDADSKLQAALATLETKHGEKLEEANGKANGYLSELREAKLGQAIADALAEHGGNPRLLTSVIKDSVRFTDEGKADFEVVGEDGNQRLSEVSGQAGNPMGLSELVGILRKDDALSGGFKGAGARGGGGKGSDTNGAGGGKNPFSADHFNLTEQGRLMKSNPAEATRLAALAGQT